jgi:hypothetical protein
VAYSLQFHPERVIPFLRDFPRLPRESRLKLLAALHTDLAVHADHYRADTSRRVTPGSPNFWYIVPIPDEAGVIVAFGFAVNDSAAQFGVLSLEYVEDRPW